MFSAPASGSGFPRWEAAPSGCLSPGGPAPSWTGAARAALPDHRRGPRAAAESHHRAASHIGVLVGADVTPDRRAASTNSTASSTRPHICLAPIWK